MTEQAGYMNQPDLIDECARAQRNGEIERQLAEFGRRRLQEWDELSEEYRDLYRFAALDVFSVLRQRGLIDLQGLELIKQSGEAK